MISRISSNEYVFQKVKWRKKCWFGYVSRYDKFARKRVRPKRNWQDEIY